MDLKTVTRILQHQVSENVAEVTDIGFGHPSSPVDIVVEMKDGSIHHLQLAVSLVDMDGNEWPGPSRVMFQVGQRVKCQGCVEGYEPEGSSITDDDLKCDICGFTNVK